MKLAGHPGADSLVLSVHHDSIPTVLLMQNGKGYLYHSAADARQSLNATV